MITKIAVSVLMTTYNREKYVAEAIESVLASTFKNFELIIVDDCSVDNTVSIIKEYECTDDRIKVYVNEKNLGQFRNRNKAASLANGEYIKFFDSDDIMNADLLEVTMGAMLRFPQADAGIECNWNKIQQHDLPVIFTPRENYINHFFKGNHSLSYGPSSSVFKRSVFNYHGGFNEKIGILADTLLMLQLATNSSIVGYKPDLFHWRRHEGQVTVEQGNHFLMFEQRAQIHDIIFNSEIPLNKEEIKILRQNYKNIFLRNIYRHFKTNRSLSKVYKMAQMLDIKLPDIFQAFFKNRMIDY